MKAQLLPKGFTLLELLVVVAIIAILAAIAIPGYREYVRRANASQVQQEMQSLAIQLTKHQGRNFSYLGFNTNPDPLEVKRGGVVQYKIEVRDGVKGGLSLTSSGVSGQSWIMTAISTDSSNYSFLFTSTGVRCKTRIASNIIATSVTDAKCGAGSETW